MMNGEPPRQASPEGGPDLAAQSLSILTSLHAAMVNFHLYPPTSDIVEGSVQRAREELDKALDTQGSITFCELEGKLLINEFSLDDRDQARPNTVAFLKDLSMWEVRSITFTERDDFDEKILDEIPNLDTILKVIPYNTLKDKFFEMEHEPDAGAIEPVDDDEKDERPVRSHRKEQSEPIRRKRREEPEEDPDEEEAPPARSKRTEAPASPMRRKPAPAKEEEPEDEPEEDPTPVRRGKSEQTSKGGKTCPYGHRFGVDTDNFDDCADCELWDDCIDKKQS